jgi:hypothetical protein
MIVVSPNAKWAEAAQPDDLRFGGAKMARRSRAQSARVESTIPVDAVLKARSPSVSQAILEAAAKEVQAVDVNKPSESSLSRAVRRDESVIAEAARLRQSRLQRLQLRSLPKRAWERLSAAVTGLLDRVAALPTAQKRLLVAVPYGLALVLVLVIVLLQVFDRRAAEEPLPGRIPPAPAAAAMALPDPPVPTVPAAPAAAAAPAESKPPPRPAEPAVAEVLRRLPVKSALFASPKKGAVKTAALPPGTALITYPTIAAPEGWILARKLEGEVGYLRKKHLDAQPEPEPAALPRPVKLAEPRRSAEPKPTATLTSPRGERAPAPEPKSSMKKHDELSADDLLAPPKKRR